MMLESHGKVTLQYLGESLFIVVPAMLLSLALVELLLPLFESIIGKSLDTRFAAPAAWLSLLALTGAVAAAGGFYPALVLSRFRPSATLKANRSTEPPGAGRLRSVLVVFQFAVTIALMAATLIIYAQVEYTLNRDPGFNADNLVFIDGVFRQEAAEQNLLKRRIAELPEVSTVSLSGYRPLNSTGNSENSFEFSPGAGTEAVDLPAISADYEFFRTYEVPIIAGRDFIEGRDLPTPLHVQDFQGDLSQSSAVVTEGAARRLGFAGAEDAVGRQISTTSGSNAATHVFTIIGVAGDSQFYSPRNQPRAEVYVISRAQGSLIDALAVRVQGETGQVLARLEEAARSVAGDVPLSASSMSQLMALEYAQERSEAGLLLGFSLLAIAIACLGLFGAASFNVERRTKEIGIRKVLGAEVGEIVRLLLWQFSRPVILANLIAWPVALWAMLNWLERFTYRIDPWLLGPICAIAGLIALLIAGVTVGGTAARAANAKPVLALRYE